MFLGFTNFYKRFIKGFNKIAVPFTLMLKTTASSIPVRPACTRTDKNELGTDDGGGIGSDTIDGRNANLSNSIKKMSSGAGFLIPKASLAFT